MTKNDSNSHFWIVLGAVNMLVLVYPLELFHRAESVEENLFAVLVLLGAVFGLVVADAISIVVADVIGTAKPRRGPKPLTARAISR